MNDKELVTTLDKLKTYLEREKNFVIDLKRYKEYMTAAKLTQKLFPEGKLELRDDPLHLGAGIIHVEDLYVMVSNARETQMFCDLITLADNFEIYPIDAENVCFAMVFNGVYKYIQ